MSNTNRPLRIVARREVLADPPRLVDFHLAPEEVTVEIIDAALESMFEVVTEDRGGCRAERVGADASRAARGSR